MSRWFHGVVLRSSLKSIIYPTSTRTFYKSTVLHSHYDTLKVNTGATLKEIKDAYLKLTKKYHPDLHPNDPKCHERFIELQEAYKILSNPDSRRNYDMKFRNRPSPKYQRPYAYPDFTQRDEWLRQEEMRREAHFQDDHARQNFNQYYSRPHKMSPEELERFHKYERIVRNDNIFYYIFGAILFGVFIECMLVKSYVSLPSQKRNDYLWTHQMKETNNFANSDPYRSSMDEEYERWNRQRPRTAGDEDFMILTRQRENRDSLSRETWEGQNQSYSGRE